MNYFIDAIILFTVFILGAVTHEMDIIRAIRKTGKSGYAVWTATIIGEIKD